MATGTIELPIYGGIADATNPPGLTTNSGKPYWLFDASTAEYVTYSFRLPSDYSSAPTVIFHWSAASTTTSHTVVWSAEVYAYTPDTDTATYPTNSFDTANTVSDDILGTTSDRLQTVSLSLSNFDSGAAGDQVVLRIGRAAADGADDLTGDAKLWNITFQYTT